MGFTHCMVAIPGLSAKHPLQALLAATGLCWQHELPRDQFHTYLLIPDPGGALFCFVFPVRIICFIFSSNSGSSAVSFLG